MAFVDTDAMGVTHHANYLRYCEEARVAWMRARDLNHTHYPRTDRVLALLHYEVWHLLPSTFDDLLEVGLQVRREGLRVHYQYVLLKQGQRVCEATTLHIPINRDLKPARPDPRLLEVLAQERWTENWLSRPW